MQAFDYRTLKYIYINPEHSFKDRRCLLTIYFIYVLINLLFVNMLTDFKFPYGITRSITGKCLKLLNMKEALSTNL